VQLAELRGQSLRPPFTPVRAGSISRPIAQPLNWPPLAAKVAPFLAAINNLGKLPSSTYDYSEAYDINDPGQVTGIAKASDGTQRGFIWDQGNGMKDLGDLADGHGETRAYEINYAGQIVGETWDRLGNRAQAFVWQDGIMRGLGVLPNGSDASIAEGINDSGVAVGTSYVGPAEQASGHRAFVWDSINGIRDLNSMLDASGSDWVLGGCRDINNSGQIVGGGYHNGEYRGFLLTPVPEPTTLVMWAGLAATGAFIAWRRRNRAA
jgi:probable HAF family extracellular repeat protein